MPSAREWAADLRRRGVAADRIVGALRKVGAIDDAGNLRAGMLDRDIEELGAWATPEAAERPLAPEDVALEESEAEPQPAEAPPGVVRIEAPAGATAPMKRHAALKAMQHEAGLPDLGVTAPMSRRPPPPAAGEQQPARVVYAAPGDQGPLGGRPDTSDLPKRAQRAVSALGDPREAHDTTERIREAMRRGIDFEDETPGTDEKGKPAPVGQLALDAVLEKNPPRDVGVVETVIKRGYAIDARIIGALSGLVTGANKGIEEAMGKPQEVGALPPPADIAEAFEATENDLAERWFESSYRAKHPIDASVAFMQNFATDLRDNALMIAELAGKVVGADISQEDVAKPLGEFLAQQYGIGQEEVGEAMLAGAIGGTAAFFAHPVETAATRPFSTALMLAPTLKAIPKAAIPAPVRSVLAKAEVIKAGIKAGAGATVEQAGIQVRKVSPFKGKRISGAERWASAKRWFGQENIEQATPEATAQMERMINAPREQAAAVRGAADEMARAIERGEVDPATLFEPIVMEPSDLHGRFVADVIADIKAGVDPTQPPGTAPVPPTPGREFASFLDLWKRAATHEVPEVRTAIEAKLRQVTRIRDYYKQRVKDLRALDRQIRAMPDDPTAPPGTARAAAAAAAGPKLARLPEAMEALKRYEEVVAAGERIVGGPDTVANRPGAPAFETTYQIPIEYEKGRARFPAAVAAERERLAPPAETATPGQLKAASAARTKLALKHITPEELERTPALGHVGTVVQAEGQKVVTPVAEEFTLAQNPRFAEMADAFVEAVAKTYRPAALVKRAAEGILDIEQARLKRTGGAGFIGRSGALRILGAVFKDVSAQLVRSPRMRAEVVKAIRARAPELPAEHIEGRLLDLGESHLLERPINYVETTAGKAVNYLDEMADVAAKKPEIMNLVRAEALRELAEVVAEDASKARAAGAIIDTIVSFGMDRFEAPYVASKFVQRVAIEGGPMPPALNRIRPAELAAELASPGRDYIGRIASAARISRKAAARRLERITTSLNNDYAPPSKSLRDHIPTSADLEQALVPGGVLTPQESPFGITAVHRGFESTAGWLYKAMDAAESQKWWRSAQRIVGMNLTAGKPSTHIYNSFSNMTLQVLRRGTPPNFAETAKVWLGDYRGGKLAGTQLEKILRGVERSGLTNTTVVEAELGTIRAPTPLTPGASKVLKPFHAWRRGLGRVYRWGDNAFKIDEAVRNAKILDGRISELAPGDTLDLKVSRRRIATLQKLSDGDIQVAVRNVGQTPSQAVIVDGQEAWNLVGRAAAKSAQALFFDYCVPEDAECLTRRGWAKWHEIRIGEDVLVLDKDSHEARWEPVTAINTFPFVGELNRIANKFCEFLYTDGHRWPVETRLNGKRRNEIVTELNTQHHLVAAGNGISNTESALSPSDAAILGWIVTDGTSRWDEYTTLTTGEHREYFYANIAQSPKKFLAKIVALLGVVPTQRPNKKSGVVQITVPLAARRRLVGAGFRKKDDLPRIVGKLSRDAAEAMWQAMVDAEASTSEAGKTITFAQNPGPVLEAFTMLCAMTGRRCRVAEHRSRCQTAIVGSRRFFSVAKMGSDTVPFRGTVWCPTTPSGTWLMRRNGAIVWTGNSDVGNWIHALRSAPGIGLVSPFLTWSYKALDIPGIKRGLVGELLLGDAQILTPSSNASVNAAQFRGAVALSARRLVMMNAMRADVLDKDDRALRSILNRVPRNAALIVLDNVTNPGFVGFKDWQASYFAEPTDALFRLGIGAYVTLSELAGGDFAPQTLYQRDARGKPDFALAGLSDDEQRGMMWRRNLWRKNATGEVWALDDGLRLAGLSGHPLMQLVYDIRASARPGRATAVSPAAVWRNFDALLTGGLVGDVIDVGIAADDPDSPWSSRALERGGKDYPPEADDDVRWALRKITSLGWRVEKIGPKAKEHFSDLRAAFRSSVLKAGKDRLASLKARGATAEEIDPVKDDLKFLARIVDEEMRAIEDGYRDVIKKVRAPRDPEVVEEPEPAAAAGGR